MKKSFKNTNIEIRIPLPKIQIDYLNKDKFLEMLDYAERVLTGAKNDYNFFIDYFRTTERALTLKQNSIFLWNENYVEAAQQLSRLVSRIERTDKDFEVIGDDYYCLCYVFHNISKVYFKALDIFNDINLDMEQYQNLLQGPAQLLSDAYYGLRYIFNATLAPTHLGQEVYH